MLELARSERIVTLCRTAGIRRKTLLGDFLASYELMPGTVAHAGYGSIVESINSSRYTTTARALFFKVSYLARL